MKVEDAIGHFKWVQQLLGVKVALEAGVGFSSSIFYVFVCLVNNYMSHMDALWSVFAEKGKCKATEGKLSGCNNCRSWKVSFKK